VKKNGLVEEFVPIASTTTEWKWTFRGKEYLQYVGTHEQFVGALADNYTPVQYAEYIVGIIESN
jgi:hypothetical protein